MPEELVLRWKARAQAWRKCWLVIISPASELKALQLSSFP
jgi:hypothetical protein